MGKKTAGVKVVVAVFCYAALFIGCGTKGSIRKDGGEASGAVGFTASAPDVAELGGSSIRNATKKTIEYTIRPHGSDDTPEKRRLDSMAVHAIFSSSAQDVTFSRSHTRLWKKCWRWPMSMTLTLSMTSAAETAGL